MGGRITPRLWRAISSLCPYTASSPDTPAQRCNASANFPSPAHPCRRRLGASNAGPDLERWNIVSGASPSLRTLPQRKQRCPRSASPGRCFRRQLISGNNGPAYGTPAQRPNAGTMSPETGQRWKHRLNSWNAGPALQRRSDVSDAGPSPRTLARRKQRWPGYATLRRCPQRYASVGNAQPSRRGRDVLKSVG